jgi:hypothetical protein
LTTESKLTTIPHSAILIRVVMPIDIIVSKVLKGDNLLLGPQTFIVKTLIIENAHSCYFYMQKQRRGNRQTARETERERVRVCECCGKTDIGIRHKTSRWKNPLTSFWDKLGRPFSGKLF